MQPDPSIIDHAAAFTRDLITRAGELSRELSESVDVRSKGERDLVTSADLGLEQFLSEEIRRAFPDHRLYGEEGARGAAESPWGWLLDPIDGTTNFAHGYPAWCISVCLEHDGTPVIGAILNPARDELFFAALGQGSTLNDQPIHVSEVDELIKGIFTFELSLAQDDPADAVRIYREARKAVLGVRINGSAALSLCDVACGRTDGYWQRHLRDYDIAAGVIIVREAGGQVTMCDGSPYRLTGTEVCATNQAVQSAVLDFIQRTDPVGEKPEYSWTIMIR